MTGSEVSVNWRIASASPRQSSGDRQVRSSPTWHTATFRPNPGASTGAPTQSSPSRRRSSARVDQSHRRRRRRCAPPVTCTSKKDPCSVRCACCCLPNLSTSRGCCQRRYEGRRQDNVEHTPQEETQSSEPPPPPQPTSSSRPPPEKEPRKRPSDTPQPPPQHPQEQCCPCLHFLGGSPYYPAPEPNTWQFVYWPPTIPKYLRRPLPDKAPRQSVISTQQRSNEEPRRRSRLIESQPKRASNSNSQSASPPNVRNQSTRSPEEDYYYCRGGWRCQCSKYELPESCILAPLPATTAPHVETTLLIPTSTRVTVPAAAPGLSDRTFRVCMPPSELPMCHCPPDCPCPHPRCSDDTKCSQPVGPCTGLYHPRSHSDPDESQGDRPYVLFGRDPLIHNNM